MWVLTFRKVQWRRCRPLFDLATSATATPYKTCKASMPMMPTYLERHRTLNAPLPTADIARANGEVDFENEIWKRSSPNTYKIEPI